MKTQNINLAEIRNDHKKAPQFATGNTHEAVITKSRFRVGGRKFFVGVQYWTPSEIEAGKRTNFDGTVSDLIEKLYN